MSKFENLWNQCAQWSYKTFGSRFERDQMGPLHHLKKEVEELIKNPNDPEEFADCMMLLCDAWRRRGGTIDELMEAVEKKLEICRGREWGPADENGVYEHVRD